MSEKFNYARSVYSLAMNDLENYKLLLEKFEKGYERADFILNYVLSQSSQDEELKDLLNDYAFTNYASCFRELQRMKKSISNYKNTISEFLGENQIENEKYMEAYNIVMPKINSYEAELDKKIKKCFEFNSRMMEDNSDLNV